jgi:EAL domain-containing protein (putative c-di-GMP-specific phosphodiesterase class I)
MSSGDDPNPLQGMVSSAAWPTSATGIQRVLTAVRTHLGMDVAFVSEFRNEDRVFTHVDAREQDRTPIKPGDTALLEQGYCQRVVDGRLPQLIPNAHALAASAELPETAAIPIGAHISVPIRLSNGSIYGTFCCFSFVPDASLTERDLQMMRAFADLVADQLDREMSSNAEREERIKRITLAMEHDEPAIVFQPIYDLTSRRISGVESLSRFLMLPARTPDVWFNEAAAVGLGPQLESLAVRKARAAVQELPRDVYVAINGSPDLVLSGALARELQDADLARVVLEITEHASVSKYDELLAELAPLRAMGLRIAIDDTGAGYSSMRHILSIEPDLLKLDMSLVRGIDRDRKRRALASALIAFARETRIEVVAEGVETAAELDTLQTLGVRKVQGYHLARPMPLSEIPRAMSLPSAAPPAVSAGAAHSGPVVTAKRGLGQ